MITEVESRKRIQELGGISGKACVGNTKNGSIKDNCEAHHQYQIQQRIQERE